MDRTFNKPPKHPRVSALQMGTVGGTWPFHMRRGPTPSPFSPLSFRDPLPKNGLNEPFPPLLIPDANGKHATEHRTEELLVKIGTHEVRRGDPYNLCPEWMVNEMVFIIIREASHDWYVLYLDVKRWKVYALDITRTEDSKLLWEEEMIKMVRFFARVFGLARNIQNVRHCLLDPTTWLPFIYPQSLPDDISRVPLTIQG
ncbi:hypothetical protein PIB30_051427 [Stylosanthes scabra]|uniref:Uncharacterized protein n=1 Tax=Stylosanthes scabra TaxID=79078 RepID=A0ABU6YG69_9FABA|nr:hypothetical protein [Stylosanthes scabra]